MHVSDCAKTGEGDEDILQFGTYKTITSGDRLNQFVL